MDYPKAKGCLADIVLPLYFISLIIGLFYLGSIVGVLLGWLDQMPGLVRQTASDGSPLPIWFYIGELAMYVLVWFGCAALYILKRWGIYLFCLGFAGFLAIDLAFDTRWVVSAVLLIIPIVLVLVSRGYVFEHRADVLPAARKLSGWDDDGDQAGRF